MSDSGYIFDIKKYSINDGPGIRTTVFFKGCPLNCISCHNPESQNIRPETVNTDSQSWSIYSQSCSPEIIGKEVTADEVFYEIKKDIPFYEESGGGVTFSGGEPLLQPIFLQKLLSMCKEDNIHTAVDTSGFTSFTNLEKIYKLTDLFLYDIKIFNEELHKEYTGVSNRIIFENLMRLSDLGSKLIIRMPIIPTINDSEENIAAVIDILRPLNFKEINLLPFHVSAFPKYKKLDRENRLHNLQPQSHKEMEELKKRFLETGFHVSIGG